MSPRAQVHRFWALIEVRRWDEVRALLSPRAQCFWWATRERFDGAEAIVHVNAVYPEGWAIHLLECNALADERVHSLVRVDQSGASFYANSFFALDGGLIARLDEYWSDVQVAPIWREGLAGRALLPTDVRPSLALDTALEA